jgi:hypothetical protein
MKEISSLDLLEFASMRAFSETFSQSRSFPMAQATKSNQAKILRNQSEILRNQKAIQANQAKILGNQRKILANQKRILSR